MHTDTAHALITLFPELLSIIKLDITVWSGYSHPDGIIHPDELLCTQVRTCTLDLELIYLLSSSLLYFLSTGGMTSTVLLSTFSMCCLGHSNKNLFLIIAHINFCTLEIIAVSHILARSVRSAACIHIGKECEGSEHGNLLNRLRAYSWNIIKRSIFPLKHTKLFFDFDDGIKSSFAICDRIWENPAYGIRARFAQFAFLVP